MVTLIIELWVPLRVGAVQLYHGVLIVVVNCSHIARVDPQPQEVKECHQTCVLVL